MKIINTTDEGWIRLYHGNHIKAFMKINLYKTYFTKIVAPAKLVGKKVRVNFSHKFWVCCNKILLHSGPNHNSNDAKQYNASFFLFTRVLLKGGFIPVFDPPNKIFIKTTAVRSLVLKKNFLWRQEHYLFTCASRLHCCLA